MLECVVNVSEGRRLDAVDLIARTAGRELLDVHVDPHHNRSVLTLVGEDAARSVAAATVLSLDLRRHTGAHPRLGVLDVVPFVPLGSATLDDAIGARDRFATWAAGELGLPCFCYGPERTLPEVRRDAFRDLAPDAGPAEPDPQSGAVCVGARPVLVAYNLWLTSPDVALARSIAAEVRAPGVVRALGFAVGDQVQVSLNLIDPLRLGPEQAYALVATQATVARAELVGLIPQAVLDAIDPGEWDRLDLAADRTIEARLAARGLQLS
jgi:glutamate formiminotransferase/glutamate formiminotransferase/formiminotetrahydrofolate cyclodeaminase